MGSHSEQCAALSFFPLPFQVSSCPFVFSSGPWLHTRPSPICHIEDSKSGLRRNEAVFSTVQGSGRATGELPSPAEIGAVFFVRLWSSICRSWADHSLQENKKLFVQEKAEKYTL